MTKEDLRIVFLGTPDFAVESLDRLVKGDYKVVGVVTMPDKPAGRGHKMLQSAVKQYAVAHGLYLMQPVRLKDPEFLEELAALRADLFIVIAFRMLPREVWQMPRLGTFNLHASLLPRYRGAAPINRAVMNGETETGVTTFMLKHEIDTGDILRQERIAIGPDDCVGDVHDRLMALGADLTLDTVDRIIAGDLSPLPQDAMLTDGEEPTPAPKIFAEDMEIRWDRPSREIHNLVRGLSPYPAARAALEVTPGHTEAVKIYRTALTGAPAADVPGTVYISGGKMTVDTEDERLEILELQAAGKKRMPVADYLRGARLVDPRFV